MKKIPSFTIDHEKLLRGIYVSRKDNVGGEVVTTVGPKTTVSKLYGHWQKGSGEKDANGNLLGQYITRECNLCKKTETVYSRHSAYRPWPQPGTQPGCTYPRQTGSDFPRSLSALQCPSLHSG